MRATVTAYQECDRLVATSFQALDYAVGRASGTPWSAAAPSLLLLGLAAGPAWERLPAGHAPAARRRPSQEWADEHPEAVQHGVDASGGLLDGLLAGAAGLPGLLLGCRRSTRPLPMRQPTWPALYPAEGPPPYVAATTCGYPSATRLRATWPG